MQNLTALSCLEMFFFFHFGFPPLYIIYFQTWSYNSFKFLHCCCIEYVCNQDKSQTTSEVQLQWFHIASRTPATYMDMLNKLSYPGPDIFVTNHILGWRAPFILVLFLAKMWHLGFSNYFANALGMCAHKKTHRHTAHKKHIHVKRTNNSSQNNEKSSVEAAPSAMTTKEATHRTMTRWLP